MYCVIVVAVSGWTQRARARASVAGWNAVGVVILVRSWRSHRGRWWRRRGCGSVDVAASDRGDCRGGVRGVAVVRGHREAVGAVEHLVNDQVALLIEAAREAVCVVKVLDDELLGVGALFLFHVDVGGQHVDEVKRLSSLVTHQADSAVIHHIVQGLEV